LKPLCEYLVRNAVFSDVGDEILFTALIRLLDVFALPAAKETLHSFASVIDNYVAVTKRDSWTSFASQNWKPNNEVKMTRCFDLFRRLLKIQTTRDRDLKLNSSLAVNLALLSAEYSSLCLPALDELIQQDEAFKSLVQANPLFPNLIIGLILRNLTLLTKAEAVHMFISREFPLASKRMDDVPLRTIARHVFKMIAEKAASNLRQAKQLSDFVNESLMDELVSYVLLGRILLHSEVCLDLFIFDALETFVSLRNFAEFAKESTNNKLQSLVLAVDAWPLDLLQKRFTEANQEVEEDDFEMRDVDPEENDPATHLRRQHPGGDDVD
jgi:hypothetical protein